MFYFLAVIAVVFFVTHVVLLFTAFPQSQLAQKRYFYSHLTLWITGIAVFALALLYAGSGRLAFLDYFDTPVKLAMILIFTAALSLTAHAIVRLIVLPLLQKK